MPYLVILRNYGRPGGLNLQIVNCRCFGNIVREKGING